MSNYRRKRESHIMKFARLLTVAALVTAFTTASFAGSCCSKKKECPSKDGKAKTEKKQETKKDQAK